MIAKKNINCIKLAMGITTILLRKLSTKKRATLAKVCVLLCLCIAVVYFRCQKYNVPNISNSIEKKDVLSLETLEELKALLRCSDKDFEPRTEIRNDFWVLKNYVRAEHNLLFCYETVTFTTHASIDYLDHLDTLIESWRAPVSLAIHAPGTDFHTVVKSIVYLRNCVEHSDLIKHLVTFHIFFSYKHMPNNLSDAKENLYKNEANCFEKPPYHINALSTYMEKNGIFYPINIARNIARDAAMTHFVLSADIDFYPSAEIPQKFLKMIARNAGQLSEDSLHPRVFPLALFQMNTDIPLLPRTKSELQVHLVNLSISKFDRSVDIYYHNIPDILAWIAAGESEQIRVLPVDNLWFRNKLWTPIFIGTHQDPHFNNRLSREGQNDRTSQAYIMCVENYAYMILSDVFLIHSSKSYSSLNSRDLIVEQYSKFFPYSIESQLKKIYGNNHCRL